MHSWAQHQALRFTGNRKQWQPRRKTYQNARIRRDAAKWALISPPPPDPDPDLFHSPCREPHAMRCDRDVHTAMSSKTEKRQHAMLAGRLVVLFLLATSRASFDPTERGRWREDRTKARVRSPTNSSYARQQLLSLALCVVAWICLLISWTPPGHIDDDSACLGV
jgi:hypothetical protein